jgi:hypothetical protein
MNNETYVLGNFFLCLVTLTLRRDLDVVASIISFAISNTSDSFSSKSFSNLPCSLVNVVIRMVDCSNNFSNLLIAKLVRVNTTWAANDERIVSSLFENYHDPVKTLPRDIFSLV